MTTESKLGDVIPIVRKGANGELPDYLIDDAIKLFRTFLLIFFAAGIAFGLLVAAILSNLRGVNAP